MKLEAGFVTSLREELAQVPKHTQTIVQALGGLSHDKLIELVQRPQNEPALFMERPVASDFAALDDPMLAAEGIAAFEAGQVATCVLLGDGKIAMSRFGSGMSVLGMQLAQAAVYTSPNITTLLMVSPSSREAIINHVTELALCTNKIGAFEQYESYRLTPDNRLLLDAEGVPELYALGDGDMPYGMLFSGVLDELKKSGVKHVFAFSGNNVMAYPDVFALGQHIASKKHVTCHVVERQMNEPGPIVAWVNGCLQSIDVDRLSDDYDTSGDQWLNSGSYIVDVDALHSFAIALLPRWLRRRRVVDNRLVVQHERSIQQLTEEFETNFVVVSRDQYLPIRDESDLKHAEALLFKKW